MGDNGLLLLSLAIGVVIWVVMGIVDHDPLDRSIKMPWSLHVLLIVAFTSGAWWMLRFVRWLF